MGDEERIGDDDPLKSDGVPRGLREDLEWGVDGRCAEGGI